MTDSILEVLGVYKDFAVQARGLVRARPRASLRALHEIDLKVQRGETFAVVGESGCGKSTLARVMMGLMPPSSGRVLFEGVPLDDARAFKRLRPRIQMVFQNPLGSLDPRMRVGDLVAEPLIIHRRSMALTPDSIRTIVAATLAECGLEPASAGRYPHQFSGGQRQRIAIARALVLRPSLLVLDEPVSALDVSIQAQIIALLQAKQREHDLTYVFISHDLSLVRAIATRVAVMYLGRICESGDVAAIFDRPRHHYTRGLLNAVPDIRARTKRPAPVSGEPPNPMHPPEGCVFHTRCPARQDRCRTEAPRLQFAENGRQVACHYPIV